MSIDALAIACCAFQALGLLLAFLRDKSETDCRQILEDYVEDGVDRGLTRVIMRAACGLPLRSPTTEPVRRSPSPELRGRSVPATPPAPGPDQVALLQAPVDEDTVGRVLREESDLLKDDFERLVKHMIENNMDHVSKNAVGRITSRVWSART